MKLYKRMIKPMINPPALQDFSCKPYPLFSDNYWVDGDFEDSLIEIWKRDLEDPMSTIGVEEKYVEVELPKPKPINVKDNNFVCFMVDIDKIDLDIALEYVKICADVLPKEVAFAMLPSIKPKVLNKDTVDSYIDEYKRRAEEKYK